jgi:hypothetical protein
MRDRCLRLVQDLGGFESDLLKVPRQRPQIAIRQQGEKPVLLEGRNGLALPTLTLFR